MLVPTPVKTKLTLFNDSDSVFVIYTTVFYTGQKKLSIFPVYPIIPDIYVSFGFMWHVLCLPIQTLSFVLSGN